jgi:hypothetical protein
MANRWRSSWHIARVLLVASAVWIVGTAVPVAAQTASDRPVTFTKDIAPILQRSCQMCHRPDSVAPMSLLTYEQARPYARAMKQRTALARSQYGRGAMPPWYIEKNIGIQQYKDDPSLSDEEIALFAAWADSGAPEGDPADLPPPLVFADARAWNLGKPDLIVSSPPLLVKGLGPDWWGEAFPPQPVNGLTEVRYVSSSEFKEVPLTGGPKRDGNTVGGLFVFHHANFTIDNGDGTENEERYPAHEVGRNGDVFPPDAGKPLKPGAMMVWGNVHTHPPGVAGNDRTARLDVGLRLHPKGYQPRYQFKATGSFGKSEIEIYPNEPNQRAESYYVLPQPMRLMNFEPHLHAAGVRMCMEAIYERAIETISCSGYDHNWVRNYYFDDNHAPLLPKGTILKTSAWFDNTAKNANILDPRNHQNWGRRSINNMFMVFNYLLPLTDEQYQEELAKRREYLNRTNGWDELIGCTGCWERPTTPPPVTTNASQTR